MKACTREIRARVSDEQTPERELNSWLVPSRRVNGKFLNPLPTAVGTLKLVFKAMPLYIRNHEQRNPAVPPGPFRTAAQIFANAPASGLRITWFGHSAMLVEIDGFRILIDPVWEKRASPQQWFGPRRFFAPTIDLRDLPELDAILISHDHYDHMGEFTLRELATLPCAAKARWITALGVGKILRLWGVASDRIAELDWMQSQCLQAIGGKSLTVTAVPARHFSGRSLFNRFTTLWGAYVIKGYTHNIYFGADTGWWEGFTEIARCFGPFDVTMLEIGAYNELWKDIHLGPDNAIRAFEAMGRNGLLMPIHWGLFDLALHAWRQPIERLQTLAAERDVALWSPQPGEPTEVEAGKPLLDLWWTSTR